MERLRPLFAATKVVTFPLFHHPFAFSLAHLALTAATILALASGLK